MSASLRASVREPESESSGPTGNRMDSLAQRREGEALERLSELYALRVEELDELRRRLDRIGLILANYLSDPQAGPLAMDALKRILDLTRYDHDG